MRRYYLSIAIAFVMFVLAASDARANILLANTGTIDPEAGFFRWYYRASLAPDQMLRAGATFTIFDFDGFAGGDMATDLTAGASWSFATSPLGPLVAPADDASELNLTWTYSGPDFTVPNETVIGTFSALSTYDIDTAVEGYFAAEAFDRDGNPVSNVSALGEIFVPEAPLETEVVPEPASMILLGTGLVATLARRRRQMQS